MKLIIALCVCAFIIICGLVVIAKLEVAIMKRNQERAQAIQDAMNDVGPVHMSASAYLNYLDHQPV